MTRLDIRLLGNFEVRLDGELVDDFESDTVRALLALLAVDPGRSWSRASMAELLWPDRAPGAALGNLRHALTVLRHAIGESASGRPYLRVTTGELTVDRGASVFVDVVELERLASTPIEAHGAVAAWERAASLLRGDVLAGIDLRAGEGWDAWLAAVRASVTRNATDVLDRLATLRERTGEHAQAELHVRHLLELDPWNERGHRQLVRVLALQGRTAHAIAHAERLEQRLGDELGVTLDPTTAELVERVRSGECPPPRSMKPAALLAERREPPRPQFVDRSNELDWLETQLDDSLAGAGRVVLVAGEVGSGKSMLLEAFARRATERMPNLLVGRGHCNAYTGAGDPYLPFRHVLATLCGDVTHEWASGALTPEQVTTIWDGLPEAVAVLLDEGPYLLGSLVDPVTLQTRLDRGLPDAPVTSRLRTTWAELAARATDPMRQQQPLIDQCGRVLLRLAEHRPVVVLIDDLHWADDGTIDLLAHLARQLRGSTLLVVAAYRPEEVWPDGNDALHRRPAQRLIHELRSLVDDGELELGDRRDFVDEWLDGRPNLLGESFRHQSTRQREGTRCSRWRWCKTCSVEANCTSTPVGG